VLVLTMFEDDDTVFAAMRAGAQGYLLQGREPKSRSTARSGRSCRRGDLLPGVARRVLSFFAAPPPVASRSRSDRARARCPRPGRRRSPQSSDRRAALPLAEDGRQHISSIFVKLRGRPFRSDRESTRERFADREREPGRALVFVRPRRSPGGSRHHRPARMAARCSSERCPHPSRTGATIVEA